jgi:hypothetical protein
MAMTGTFVLAIVASLALGSPVLAGVDYRHLSGEDPYKTSVALSQAAFSAGTQTVVLANGEDFRYAVCANTLAAAYEGALLLTPMGSLDASVRGEIARLTPENILLVGVGSSVVTATKGAFPELAASGAITALLGTDIYDTARLVAHEVLERVGRVWGVVILPSEQADWVGSCAVSVSSFASAERWPVLFTPAAGPLPEATRAAIKDLGGARGRHIEALMVGTPVDPGISAEVVELRSKDVFQISATMAEHLSSKGLGFSHTMVISGYDGQWRHGLAAGAYLAKDGGLVLTVDKEALPSATFNVLRSRSKEIDRLDFCGPLATVAEQVEAVVDAEALPGGFGTIRLGYRSYGEDVTWVEQRLADLSYRPGPVDGLYDARTVQAVLAFEKWEGVRRDGLVKEEQWMQLLMAEPPVPRAMEHGRWIEIDRKKQILLYCIDGTVERCLPVSTGTPTILYGQETPLGVFHIVSKNKRERKPRYHPMYIRTWGNLAIHGYEYVPSRNVSHGCIRITIADMDDFHDAVAVGTPVYIYE